VTKRWTGLGRSWFFSERALIPLQMHTYVSASLSSPFFVYVVRSDSYATVPFSVLTPHPLRSCALTKFASHPLIKRVRSAVRCSSANAPSYLITITQSQDRSSYRSTSCGWYLWMTRPAMIQAVPGLQERQGCLSVAIVADTWAQHLLTDQPAQASPRDQAGDIRPPRRLTINLLNLPARHLHRRTFPTAFLLRLPSTCPCPGTRPFHVAGPRLLPLLGGSNISSSLLELPLIPEP